jgi:hypothetical protein
MLTDRTWVVEKEEDVTVLTSKSWLSWWSRNLIQMLLLRTVENQ